MIKAKLDRKKGLVNVKSVGSISDQGTEVLTLIKIIHSGVAEKNADAAEELKKGIIGALIAPNSPVWEVDHGENK